VNAPLRRAGVVIMVLFGLLFANLNWVQAYKADEYRTSDYNGRVQVSEYERQRGTVEAGGEAIAESKPTNGRLKYLRAYPFEERYAHVVGYKPVNGAATGIERAENEFLAGTSNKLIIDRWKDMFTGDNTGGGNVVLTLNRRAQQTSWRELTNNRNGVDKGAAIAIDPRTGGVQALVSMPSFDPNPLVSHDTKAAEAAYKRLEGAEDGPLKNRALGEVLPPGSTFKVIMAAAALENGITPETSIRAGARYTPPTSGSSIKNAAPSICPESEVTLLSAVTESCNTGFAQLGVRLGADVVKAKARAFGFEQTDLTVGNLTGSGLPVAASRTGDMANPDGGEDTAALAQSSIGQNNVRMTVVQGALVAAAVANGGSQMRPYLIQRLLGGDRRPIYNANPAELREPVTGDVARDLQTMMESVVDNGTGRNADINGFRVGGKTGTAEAGENAKEHGWFVGWVQNERGEALSAVCVVLENAGNGGSAEAARIGGQIMRSVVGREGGG
jgi:penicillin-binding protein A